MRFDRPIQISILKINAIRIANDFFLEHGLNGLNGSARIRNNVFSRPQSFEIYIYSNSILIATEPRNARKFHNRLFNKNLSTLLRSSRVLL